ncbi:MAG: hypothetical protein AAGL34_04855 [Bacteroidota bacterium]
MKIQIKKGDGKPSILTCIRKDGSTSWAKLYPGMEAHDLAHYVVETILEFENAFYGMVAKGIAIEDFEIPRERRPEAVLPQNLPPESLVTEHLVNLLMVKWQSGEETVDLSSALAPILMEHKLSYPKQLNSDTQQHIWKEFTNLLSRWDGLPPGEMIEFDFDVSV